METITNTKLQKLQSIKDLQKKIQTVVETLENLYKTNPNDEVIEKVEKDAFLIGGFIDVLLDMNFDVEVDAEWEFRHINKNYPENLRRVKKEKKSQKKSKKSQK
jgi:hypothetical protein